MIANGVAYELLLTELNTSDKLKKIKDGRAKNVCRTNKLDVCFKWYFAIKISK